MPALRLRVTVHETRLIAPFYDQFLSVQKNGNKAVAAFWSLLRYQIKIGELDSQLDSALRKLHAYSMHTPATLLAKPLRFDFAADDSIVIEKCKRWGEKYSLGKADTIKLLLIASCMLDAEQNVDHTPISALAA